MTDQPGVRSFLDREYSGFATLGDLNDDGPGDDRTDNALRTRSDAYAKADALNWLLDGAPKAPQAQAVARGAQGVPPTPAAAHGAEPAMTTLGRGVSELPRQAVGGVRDAAQNTSNLLQHVGDWFDEQVSLGGIQLTNNKGELDLQVLSPSAFTERRQAGMKAPELPDVGAPQTVAGSVVRGVTQFVRPYVR